MSADALQIDAGFCISMSTFKMTIHDRLFLQLVTEGKPLSFDVMRIFYV